MRAVRPNGETLWPDHMAIENFRRLYHSGGSARFMAIYMQDASGLAGDIFDPAHFWDYAHPNYTERQPSATRPGAMVTLTAQDLLDEGEIKMILPDIRSLTSLQSHDLALGQKETADQYVRCNFYANRAGLMFIEDVYADRLTDVQMMRDIVNSGRHYRCRAIGIESNAFQSLLINQLKRGFNMPFVELDPAGRDKVIRARPAAAHFENDKVMFRRGARWNSDVRYQLEAFPNGVHDDIPDAISYAYEMCLRFAGGDWQRIAQDLEDLRKTASKDLSDILGRQ